MVDRVVHDAMTMALAIDDFSKPAEMHDWSSGGPSTSSPRRLPSSATKMTRMWIAEIRFEVSKPGQPRHV